MSVPHEETSSSAAFKRDHNSASPPKSTKTSENLNNKSKSQSPGESHSSDPFSSSFSSDFYNKARKDKFNRPPRPRLSERIFNNHPHHKRPNFEDFDKERSSIFDKGSFVEDLRNELDQDRKMFFDGVDPFGHFPSPRSRGTSPAPNSGASDGPRMGRQTGAGFPFESTARTRLDDLSGRHPMFSTMRRQPWDVDDPFARAGSPFQRERNNSGSSGCASGSSTASAEHEHIIPIRIERSDGTSTTTSGGVPSANASSTASSGKNPISSTPIPMPAPEGMTTPAVPQTPPKVHQTLGVGPQRSSTEIRKSPSPAPGSSPRAQSAPPDSVNGSGDKKFVSSVNIESNSPAPPSGPQTTQLGGNCTKEQNPAAAGIGARQIPILIDGLLGRPQNRPAAQPMPDVPNQQPQPSQQKASRPAERDLTPPTSKKPTIPKDPMEKILEISDDVKEWEVKIDEFVGSSRKDKEYLLLDEMLTRDLIKLDVIETEGREDVRLARKDCIKLIQNCIAKLESKVPLSNVKSQAEHNMELELFVGEPNSQLGQNMEIDGVSQKSTSKESIPSSNDGTRSSNSAAIPLGSDDTQVGTGASESVKVSG